VATRLADRLTALRSAGFVGRTTERALFGAALRAEDLSSQVVYVYGPGGIGKTSLVKQFASMCKEGGAVAIHLDGREIEPSPRGFLTALRWAAQLEDDCPPAEGLAARSERQVLLVDTYESLTPLDSWVRDTFLPQLADNVLVVLSGRKPPAAAWRCDPGWQQLLTVLPLRNLTPEESRTHLANRGVPPSEHQPVLDFTHGHPLALSLVADAYAQADGYRFQVENAPNIVSALLGQFVGTLPSAEHRKALELCAQVRSTTEGVLTDVLQVSDGHELFEWLRSLSFVESGSQGLFPHDLAREALAADLRWRNPDWYAELHARARSYYGERLLSTRGPEQQRILFDYVFLHRDNPMMRPYLEWQETGSTMPDAPRPGEQQALSEMVERHEGAQSASWLEFWAERQPEGFVVYRDEEGRPSGLVVQIALEEAAPEDRERDPATQAAWRHLQTQAPLRPRERATLFRFWMAADSYQDVSAIQSLIFGRAAQYYLTTPGLAYSFFPVADCEFWTPMFSHVDLPRCSSADFTTEGRGFGVFGHDWRIRPPLAWLSLLGDREIMAPQPARTEPQALSAVVLSEPEFAGAVREALRQFHRADSLRSNALLRSRLVLGRTAAGVSTAVRIEALRQQITEAAASLRTSARDAKLYSALERTYFEPAASQEQAAEQLDLPFSTYRRYLQAAIARIVALLWQRELGSLDQ
jgi:AAA ATPase domain